MQTSICVCVVRSQKMHTANAFSLRQYHIIKGDIMEKKRIFSKTDVLLWIISVSLITISFFLFGGNSILTLAASLTGVTSIIINAKGHPAGQVLMVIFSILYGIISYSFSYYGEMATYLGMTGPMAFFSFISWIRNPYKKGSVQVKVNRIKLPEICIMLVITAAVTFLFFHILRFFGTSSLALSTFSVTTSFAAVYLTFRRSPYFSLIYAMNDMVLIVLWSIASLSDSKYISVVICFLLFMVCDIYGFINWKKMEKYQFGID